MLSIFYTRKEIATRIAILYTGNVLATAFAGLIAAGVFHGMHNLAGTSLMSPDGYKVRCLKHMLTFHNRSCRLAMAFHPSGCRYIRHRHHR